MTKLRSTVLALAATVSLTAASFAESAPKEFWVYFGTYTGPVSKGIYRSRFDAATGHLTAPELAATMSSPSFLALHPRGNVLYAVNENSTPTRETAAGIGAFSLNASTGALTLLNQQSIGGDGACHVSVDRDGKTVMVANYNSGTLAAIRLEADGRFGALGTVVQHTGSSVNPSRQKEPHAHSIYPTADNRFALAADLGLDRVLAYRLDPATATLTRVEQPAAVLPPGSGPRHIAFHPNGQFAYVIDEMLCTVAVFRFDAKSAAMTDIENVSTLPPGVTRAPNFSCAEIAVHPNGRVLYASTRGHNSITVYAIDASTGKLTQIENQSTRGNIPRHFALDPTGTWLIAENQNSNNVGVFRVDEKSGRLTPTGPMLDVPSPVCSLFVPIR